MFGYTQLDLAERFVRKHGARLRHCSRDGWRAWDGRGWPRDDVTAQQALQDLLRTAFREAPGMPARQRIEECMTAEGVRDILWMASAMRPIAMERGDELRPGPPVDE